MLKNFMESQYFINMLLILDMKNCNNLIEEVLFLLLKIINIH